MCSAPRALALPLALFLFPSFFLAPHSLSLASLASLSLSLSLYLSRRSLSLSRRSLSRPSRSPFLSLLSLPEASLPGCKKITTLRIDGCPIKDSKVKKYVEGGEIKNLLKYLEKNGGGGGKGGGGGGKGKGGKKR